MYAAIVAAWAVYLVPMWLRREDELNRARQTRRYSAAIKVLSHKESFERRWAQNSAPGTEADAAQLPIAAGQGPVAPPTRKDAAGPGKARTTKSRPAADVAASTATGRGTKTNAGAGAGAGKGGSARKGTVAAASGKLGTVVSAPINSAWTAEDEADKAARQETPTEQSRQQPFAATQAPTAAAVPAAATAPAPAPKPRTAPRTGLMVRRRRMVTLLFAVSTIGALVSADLGTGYIWAMIAPAALLSAYIVWLRRDERIRAAEKARRSAARVAQARAEQARAAARAAQEQAQTEREAAEARAEAEARAQERAQAEALVRAQAARRRSAAARSRAQAYAPKPAGTSVNTADQPPTRRVVNE